MVQGVLVCGTFLTKRALMIIASILFLVLVLGCVSLGIGVAMACYGPYNYWDTCITTQLSLIINGGILMGFTVIGLIVVVVFACRMTHSPAPTMVQQPSVFPQPYVTSVYGQPTAAYPANVYQAGGPGQPQPPHAVASTSAGVSQGYNQQYPTSGPQKQDPEAALRMAQHPPTQF